MEDLDELLDCLPHQPERELQLYPPLKERSLVLDSQLQEWSLHSGLSVVNFVESKISTHDQPTWAPSSEDFAIAHLGVLYWVTCLLLYQILSCHLGQDSPMDFPDRMEPRQYCRKIMQLMPYFQRPNMGEFFFNIATLPAITVTRFLDRYDPPNQPSYERAMIGDAFKAKYRRQMEHFLGAWPWRTPWCQRELDGPKPVRHGSRLEPVQKDVSH